jgi:hypothetical protein
MHELPFHELPFNNRPMDYRDARRRHQHPPSVSADFEDCRPSQWPHSPAIVSSRHNVRMFKPLPFGFPSQPKTVVLENVLGIGPIREAGIWFPANGAITPDRDLMGDVETRPVFPHRIFSS